MGEWSKLLSTLISSIVYTIVTVIVSVAVSNFDRLFKYYKRRVNWFRPEFDLKPGESFDIITSSRKKGIPKNASRWYVVEDETVIGDIEPVLIALRGRTFKVQHYLPERFPKWRWDENIISFGGEVGNELTGLMLNYTSCPLRFNGYEIIDRNDKIKYLSKWDKEGRIIIDYALIIRNPNPLYRELNKLSMFFRVFINPVRLARRGLLILNMQA